MGTGADSCARGIGGQTSASNAMNRANYYQHVAEHHRSRYSLEKTMKDLLFSIPSENAYAALILTFWPLFGRRREPPTLRDGRATERATVSGIAERTVLMIDEIQGLNSTKVNM